MGAKGSSATIVPPEDLGPRRPQSVPRQRQMQGLSPVGPLAKGPGTESATDLTILNRNARRLNREARDVLGFQVPV
jgi:hypothetical protein